MNGMCLVAASPSTRSDVHRGTPCSQQGPLVARATVR